MSNSDEWRDRVALVTGGGGAIGSAIAQALASRGAIVHIADVTERDEGGGSRRHVVDVSSPDAVERLVQGILAEDGRIDYLVSTAAVFPARPFLEIALEEWRQTIAVNATGTFLICRAVLPGMVENQFGRVVLFSSMLARTGGTNCASYATSKGMVLGLARTAALETARDNIRINTLTPGLSDTPQPRGHLSEAQLEAKAAAIPLKRLGSTDDMVEACLFLLSDDWSGYFTGQDLRVNGGSTIW